MLSQAKAHRSKTLSEEKNWIHLELEGWEENVGAEAGGANANPSKLTWIEAVS